MSARGDRTREHLIDVAERLFGDRGVDGVSLREIRLAAGQRNAGALQYHFGDREGLLRAIAERHLPRVSARAEELYEQAIDECSGDPRADSRADSRAMVEVVVRPPVEYLELGRSERSWTKICGELGPSPQTGVNDMRDNSSPAVIAAGTALFRRMVVDLPESLAIERLVMISHNTVHLCADRARLRDATDPRRALTPAPVFVANLVDMACAALFAPVSPELREALSPVRSDRSGSAERA